MGSILVLLDYQKVFPYRKAEVKEKQLEVRAIYKAHHRS